MTFVRNKQEKTGASSSQWRMAVYVRLSKEDGDKLESDSIQNQKRIIEQYIKYLQDQGEKIVDTEVYSDDGYPGGNFERPEYKRMIADIEAGKINCVIFKDNSRLGRNYPELGRTHGCYILLQSRQYPPRHERVSQSYRGLWQGHCL